MDGRRIPQESAKLGGRQCNHRTEYPRFSRYFAQRRVLYFHDAHERVYAADKNVTGFDVSWIPHDGAMDSSDASNVYITGQ
jgi:hypothetical protein